MGRKQIREPQGMQKGEALREGLPLDMARGHQPYCGFLYGQKVCSQGGWWRWNALKSLTPCPLSLPRERG
jgi:hypothetical protein